MSERRRINCFTAAVNVYEIQPSTRQGRCYYLLQLERTYTDRRRRDAHYTVVQ